jgi:hypothetical protein
MLTSASGNCEASESCTRLFRMATPVVLVNQLFDEYASDDCVRDVRLAQLIRRPADGQGGVSKVPCISIALARNQDLMLALWPW